MAQPAPRVEIGGVVMDFEQAARHPRCGPVRLTPKEYDFLAVLFRNAGRVVTHCHNLTSVWGPAHTEDTQ